MQFLVVLLAAALLIWTPLRHGVPLQPLQRWCDEVLQRTAAAPGWRQVLLLLLPLVPLWWLLNWADQRFWAFPVLLMHLLLLLLALTPRDPLRSLIEGFAHAWWRGDHQAAALLAERDIGVVADDPVMLLDRVRDRVLLESLQGYLLPLFWYLLLGPLAALAAALCTRLTAYPQASGARLAGMLVHALAWLPARLLVLSLALTGNFDAVLAVLRRYMLDWDIDSTELLAQAAAAAEQGAEPVAGPLAGRRLLLKALLVWAVVLAFIAVLG